MTERLDSDLTYNGHNQQALHAYLVNLTTLVNQLRTTVNALVTDMASRISDHNTLRTKLNADAGVTDTNYAAATAITATAPTEAAVSLSKT